MIPLIGQRKDVPPIHVAVGVDGAEIVLVTTLMGANSMKAAMGIPVATQVMVNLGNAIEHVAPGQLVPILERWLFEAKQKPIDITLNGADLAALNRGGKSAG